MLWLAKVWKFLRLPKSLQLALMRVLQDQYLKAKEHPKEGLEREIEEETGLVVSADLRYKIRTDREEARLDIVYIGSFIGGEFHASTEVVEAKFFPFADIPMIHKDDLLLIEKILHNVIDKQKTTVVEEYGSSVN
jgi:8-oxo-dGTP pyrophosphatase MutT (NUDIX family)